MIENNLSSTVFPSHVLGPMFNPLERALTVNGRCTVQTFVEVAFNVQVQLVGPAVVIVHNGFGRGGQLYHKLRSVQEVK